MGRSAARGFTLTELIVVMSLLGLLAAIAVPRMTDRSALQERGVRDQLRQMLASARQLAITRQREVCVLTTPALARLVYVTGGACSPATPVADPGGGGPWVLTPPAGITLGGAPLVRFNTRGQPVPAVDQALSVGTLALTVFRETGHVQ